MLTGVIPPLVTPMRRDASGGVSVDTGSVGRLVEHLVSHGVSGLFVLGSSGEAALLTDTMRREMLRATVAAAAGRVSVLAGAIETGTLRVIDRIRDLEQQGADGVVVTAPFYTRTAESEIREHFSRVAAATTLPVYAYNIPVSTHVELGTRLLLDLAEQGHIAGVKDSSGNSFGIRQVIAGRERRRLTDFSVLTGSEVVTDVDLRLGADGVVPGLGNIDPAAYVRLVDAVGSGDLARADAEQHRLIDLFGLVDAAPVNAMGRGSAALGAFKAALELLGVIDTHVTAPPYLELDDSAVDVVRGHLVRAALL